MIINERHNEILNLIKEKRSITVAQLCERLFVSEATVRRDLAQLQRLGLVERTRGGAVACNEAEEISHFVRLVKNAAEKERIATHALSVLPAYNSVFVDASSTALALAERMNLEHKTVVTYNLETALRLSGKPNVNLVILGGAVHYNTASATGAWTARLVCDFRFDLVICSCSAICGSDVLESTSEQREIKQAALARGGYRILLADHTKFERSALYRIADVADYDLVITDEPISAEFPNLQVAK